MTTYDILLRSGVELELVVDLTVVFAIRVVLVVANTLYGNREKSVIKWNGANLLLMALSRSE